MRVFGRTLSLPFWKPRNTTLANPDQWLIDALTGSRAVAGVKVTPLTAAGVPTVLACVSRVSATLSSVPLKLYRKTRTKDGGWAKELATDHYLYRLLTEETVPDEMTCCEFVRAVQANATLRNEGAALIVRNMLGEVSELVPIVPSDLTKRMNTTTGRIEYRLRGEIIDKKSLLIIKGLTFDGFYGADPLVYAREAIGLTIALQDNAARFFSNGSRASAILMHPGALSTEAQDRIRKKVINETSGDNANGLVV